MNELEELLERAGADPSERPAFYRLLVRSVILVLAPYPAHVDDQGYHRWDQPLGFIVWGDDQSSYVPLFTSIRTLVEATSGSPEPYAHVKMQAVDAFRAVAVKGHNAVLNPASASGKEFSAAEVASLAIGKFFSPQLRDVLHPSEVVLSPPESIPSRLLEVFTRYLSTIPAVESAHLASVTYPADRAVPRLVLAIKGQGDLSTAIQDLGIIAREVIPPKGPTLDVMVLERSGVINGYFHTESSPFYRRGGA